MTSVEACIVGSGPSGFFAADALLRKAPGIRIDILDRLPTPYGLVRGGVAPDHQGTKSIARQFERICQRPNVRFLGNVALGTDVSYQELKDLYDLVFLAFGSSADRRLGIPGEDLPGVYGSAAFVGWYNGHPDHGDLSPLLDRPGVAIIGNGNVALDVARVLAKTPEEMAASDLCRHAGDAIAAAPLTDIYVIGRRGPAHASFTPAELAELGQLQRSEPDVDPTTLDEAAANDAAGSKVIEKNLEILREFAGRPRLNRPVTLHFFFHTAPQAILGGDRVEALRLARTKVIEGRCVATDDVFDLPVGAVVSCIGYHTTAVRGVPFDEARGVVRNRDGFVEPGVYVVGWSKRGPSGTIPTNRADSFAVVERALAEFDDEQGGKPGGRGLDRLLSDRSVRVVSFADWQTIDQREITGASRTRPREKLTQLADLLAVIGSRP